MSGGTDHYDLNCNDKLKKTLDSTKISKYDEAVVKSYKKFVGENNLKELTRVFSPEKFARNWKQVMCSPSTKILGSGPNYSSVEATYKLKKDGIVSVKNDAFDTDFYRVSITGTSRARDAHVPTCRTVNFDNILKIEGDYWLIFATPSFKSCIVAAPIILRLFNRPLVIAKNFGFYVLTRNRRKFWSSPEEYQPIIDALKKYRFNKFWNKPVATAETFEF
jgi:lipocalin